MWFLIGAGTIGAGLFVTLRSLIPWVRARRTGVILSHNSGREVARTREPDRFHALLKQRFKGVIPGIFFVVAGALWLLYSVWELSPHLHAG